LQARPLDERARARLARVLAEDRPEPVHWIERIVDWGRLEGRDPFTAALESMFHLRAPEADATQLLEGVLRHREDLKARLGRDPGVRVAGIDYLTNLEPRLSNPVVVEGDDWERTLRSARSDPLTGLNNREIFHVTLVREIRRARRFRSDLSLLMLDLDEFKEVNDRHGHLFGDRVLERLGTLLRRSIRETDVACRYGGEEFAVVLPQTDRLGAYEAGERIPLLTESRFATEEVDGIRVALTLCAGVATFPDDGGSATELIARADAALYDAKAAGKNRVHLRHPERRGAVRYPARRDRTLLLEVTGAPARRVVALDVSRDGILVECEAPVPAGGSVELLVGDDDRATGRRPHVLRGRVVRSDSSGAIGRLGLAFEFPIPDAVRLELAAPPAARHAARGAA
jgi:diguanylate cyclase (GGDEF)-like protein